MTEEVEESAEMEMDASSEIIAACNALETVDGVDAVVLGKKYTAMVKRIKRRSLAIIDQQIKYLYDCLFDKDDTDSDE